MNNPAIRLGRAEDLNAVRAFDEFSNYRAREIAEERLYVFEADSTVEGYLTMAGSPFLGHPYVEFLCVAPAHRRFGIARALLTHAESLHRGKRLVISTEESNEPMHLLLANRGYILSGSLGGLNRNGDPEVYYYKNIPE